MLPDARSRLLLALDDHNKGMDRLDHTRSRGMLTDDDYAERAAFLRSRLIYARADFLKEKSQRP